MRGGAESIVSCSLFLLGGTVILHISDTSRTHLSAPFFSALSMHSPVMLHVDRLIFPPVGRAAAQMDVNILTFLCRRAEKWKKLYLTAEK